MLEPFGSIKDFSGIYNYLSRLPDSGKERLHTMHLNAPARIIHAYIFTTVYQF
jgi:hypothetical protein